MKPIFKQFLKYYLKIITKLVLFFRRPVVIAVAGSTNKTFVVQEIKKVLEKRGFDARSNPKNFNTEIGLPLAILNLPSGYNSYLDWLPVMRAALCSIFSRSFPRFLVLEFGVSKRGDMKYLLSIVKPEISVITSITQRYIESFSGMDDMAEEYKYLVVNTKKEGLVAANYDNPRSREVGKSARAKARFYGSGKKCHARLLDLKRTLKGEAMKAEVNGRRYEKEIDRFGTHHAYSFLASALIDEYAVSKYNQLKIRH